jgi:cardiolipin synthase (CMP-forming)
MKQSFGVLVTPSNVISMVRLALSIPVAICLYHNLNLTAFVLCWIAAATDWLDGFIARKTNTVSEWGKIIDPIADKVLVGTVVVMLLLDHRLPLWFVAAVVARDAAIVYGSVVAQRHTSVILPSLFSGKLAVSAIALTGAMAMITTGIVLTMLMIVSCCLMAVSLYQYGTRLHGIIQQTQRKNNGRSRGINV